MELVADTLAEGVDELVSDSLTDADGVVDAATDELGVGVPSNPVD